MKYPNVVHLNKIIFFVMYLPSFRNSSSASAFSDVFEDIFCMNFWFSYNNDD